MTVLFVCSLVLALGHEVEAARAGRLQRETLVWSAGMADWLPAGDVNALAELFPPPFVPGDEGPQGGDAAEPANA